MNRLKELRENEDISLARLCAILKRKHNISVSPSQLLYYETGEREPRNKEIWEELAKHFNVSVSYLLGYSDKVNAKEKLLDIIISEGYILQSTLDKCISKLNETDQQEIRKVL